MDNKEESRGEVDLLASLVHRIHLFNHMWKIFQQRYGNKHTLTVMLERQKTDLQNSLLRSHASVVSLYMDKEAGDNIVSIQLRPEADCKWCDAAHIPVSHLENNFHSFIRGDL